MNQEFRLWLSRCCLQYGILLETSRIQAQRVYVFVRPAEKDRSQGRQQKVIFKLSGWGRETPPRTVRLVVGVGFTTALFPVRGDTDEKAIVAARHGA